MKLLIAVCFAALAAVAYSEYCDHDSDCTMTVCGPGFHVDCYRHTGGDQVCTCLQTSTDFKCASADTCHNKYGSCTHGDHHWHCIDQRCRCSWFGGGGSGGK